MTQPLFLDFIDSIHDTVRIILIFIAPPTVVV